MSGWSAPEAAAHRPTIGATKGRLGFLALLQRIRNADQNREQLVVAAYDQSRLSRNNLDSLNFYALVEARAWVDVVLVDGRFERSPSGELTWAVMAATAAHLRKTTGQKIRDAYRHFNARGEATGMAPYGYRRADAGFEIHEAESAVVRRLFADYGAGQASARVLAARLNAEGVKKPGSRTHGLGWVPDTIVDLLQNVAYVGKTYTVSRARREGQLITAAWPAIVEKGAFDRVQVVLAKNRISGRGGVRRGETRSYALAGLLQCAACGRPMRSYTDHSGAYYVCRRDVPLYQQCRRLGAGFARRGCCPGPRCSLIAWMLCDQKTSTARWPLLQDDTVSRPMRWHRSNAAWSASGSCSPGATSMRPTTCAKLGGWKSYAINFAAPPCPYDQLSPRASGSSGSAAMRMLAGNCWPPCSTA